MIATMFLQIKLNPTPPDPTQAKIMMIMPLVFGGMMFFFPAGLVLYWCVNNAVSIAQQRYIMHKLDKENAAASRSEEHTSELQSLMRNSYAVFCLKKKTQHKQHTSHTNLSN